ncbi:hypothetical protein ACOME3_008338 [Neoechinorhynchus agilis]
MYGGTYRLMHKCVIPSMGFQIDFVDCRSVQSIISMVKKNTQLVWLETPTNPMMSICDIRSVITGIKAIRSDIIVVVDNTFASPVFQKPLDLGADLAVHSVTKYLNGHSDVVMGAIMTNNDDLYQRLKFLQNALGIVPGPMDCYLVNRGMKTLPLRMERHFQTALSIAKQLDGHPKIARVLYPFLETFPQFNLAKSQMTGCGGIITLELKDKSIDRIKKFASSVKVFSLAESLGGFDSLLCVPALMTHASIDENVRKTTGVDASIIRLSVGFEEPEDLVADILQALEHLKN